MIIHWPAFPCWATPSPSPQSLKTSTKITSSNCISSPTSTISDRRVNTRSKGKQPHHTNPFSEIVFFSFLCFISFFLSRRWMEVIRSATVPSGRARVPNSKESHAHWAGSPRFLTLSLQDSLLFFLHISWTLVHVSMHIWCFLML